MSKSKCKCTQYVYKISDMCESCVAYYNRLTKRLDKQDKAHQMKRDDNRR